MAVSDRAVRRNCWECCGGDRKAVTWCSCDGLHSTNCEFWNHRFGMGPERAARTYGRHVVTPELMPEANHPLDDLPANPRLWSPPAEPGEANQAQQPQNSHPPHIPPGPCDPGPQTQTKTA